MRSRTIPSILLFAAGLMAGTAEASTSAACAAQFKETSPAALELDYEEFDQRMGKGFRALADKGCDKEAGDLIEQYIERHKTTQSSLRWHLAQMRAMAGQNEEAAKHARSTLWPEATATGQSFKWNEYVQGTIAFLENDKAKLIENRDRLSDYVRMHKANASNLAVLNRLVDNFGKPYKEAMSVTPAKK